MTVNAGPNDSLITVFNSATGGSSSYPVSPGKDTSVPVPNVPGGTVLSIQIGTGINAKTLIVEVIVPGP